MSDIRFAKLFEKEGRQLLVTKESDDESMPALQFRITTRKSGHSLTLKASFKNEEVRDKAFTQIEALNAWDMIENAPGADM